jgi:hypothetical protein
MFRVFADLCIKAADRVGYPTTLARLNILDRFAGPLLEPVTDRVINEEIERLRQAFASLGFDDRRPPAPRSGGSS